MSSRDSGSPILTALGSADDSLSTSDLGRHSVQVRMAHPVPVEVGAKQGDSPGGWCKCLLAVHPCQGHQVVSQDTWRGRMGSPAAGSGGKFHGKESSVRGHEMKNQVRLEGEHSG